jgi:hypothetical protein
VESLLAMRDKFLLHLLCQKTTQSKFPTLQANRKRVRVGPKVVRNFRQGSVFNVMLNQGCSCLHGKQGQSTLQQFQQFLAFKIPFYIAIIDEKRVCLCRILSLLMSLNLVTMSLLASLLALPAQTDIACDTRQPW